MQKFRISNCFSFSIICTLLVNAGLSTLTIKNDDEFEEYQTINEKGEIQKETFQFLPEDWVFSYFSSVDEDDNEKIDCWMQFGLIPSETIILIKKSENSKDNSKVEMGDKIFWLIKKIGVSQIIKKFSGIENCNIDKSKESVFELKNVLKSFEVNYKMNEDEIYKLANSFEIHWIEFNLPEFTLDQRDDVKELMANKNLIYIFPKLEFEPKEDIKDKINVYRWNLTSQLKIDLDKIVNKMQIYCEGPGRIKKSSPGFLDRIFNFFINLFWSSEANEDDQSEKAVFCDYDRYKNLTINILDLMATANSYDIFKGVFLYLSYYRDWMRKNFNSSINLDDGILWDHLFKKQIEGDEKLDFKTVIKKPFKEVGSTGAMLIVEPENNDSFKIEIELMQKIIENIHLILIGSFDSPKDEEEELFIESLESDIKEIDGKLAEWTDFFLGIVNNHLEKEINEAILNLEEIVLKSKINNKFEFLTKDGLFDHQTFLKLTMISGVILPPDYMSETTPIQTLEQSKLILV